jgi:hypothetical protein
MLETPDCLWKGIKINVVGRQGYWLNWSRSTVVRPGYIDEQFAAPEGTRKTARRENRSSQALTAL